MNQAFEPQRALISPVNFFAPWCEKYFRLSRGHGSSGRLALPPAPYRIKGSVFFAASLLCVKMEFAARERKAQKTFDPDLAGDHRERRGIFDQDLSAPSATSCKKSLSEPSSRLRAFVWKYFRFFRVFRGRWLVLGCQ